MLPADAVTARRSVDWPVLLGAAPTPVFVPKSARGELASLLSAFDMLLTADHTDAILRRAVEIFRRRIGLVRVGIFVIDEAGQRMLGTWGTDLGGEIVDEHHVMFDLNEGVLDVFRRAERQGEHFTVLDDCPIVVQRKESSEVVGRGWLACTPIRTPRARLGMMFNDAGLSGAPFDESKQARAAIFCSLLGSAVDLARAQPAPARGARRSAGHPKVRKAIEMLAEDPSLVGKAIAASLDVSLSQLVRLFKSEVGISLVEYRNRLRLERFRVLVDTGEDNLLDAAEAAGFGSYAQFHRVFRAIYGAAPSRYLRGRNGRGARSSR